MVVLEPWRGTESGLSGRSVTVIQLTRERCNQYPQVVPLPAAKAAGRGRDIPVGGFHSDRRP